MNEAGVIRAFIGLPLPPLLIASLSTLQRELQLEIDDRALRWTRPEQLHLTLQFLGDMESGSVPALAERLAENLEPHSALELSLRGLGCFPNARRPRVLWAGLSGEALPLQQLAAAAQEASRPFTQREAGRPFSAHITLARLRPEFRAGAKLAEALRRREQMSFGEWTAGEVELMRSELGAGGSKYSRLATIPLKLQERSSFSRRPV